ncbi:MAG: thioredoxin family protein [Lutibacter sp.]|jgi:thioredoxin-related protein|uniref:thioredoxin family protein n=1 Tax=Lutibacter sp. TaxID=1925666 RepID=UPI00299E0CB7|nr:thioredoxin family protein [Lutibacter sp.]MDX1829348.1 thioredoxin family protein [Lutibacter sp.]
MKKISILFCLLFSIHQLSAQVWHTNLNEAEKIASQKNERIVMVFQGSDWCGPCIKLDKQIWSSDQFINYAKNHFVMVKVNFPRKKKNKLTKEQQDYNNHLMETYDKKGYFPYVVVLDKNAKFLGSTGYKNTTPENYIKLLNSF